MQRKIKENKILIIGILIVLLGLSLIGYKIFNYYQKQDLEQELIEEFFIDDDVEVVIPDETKENSNITTSNYSYLMILEIPKINLKKGIYDKSSKYNSVNYGIQILKQSGLPDVEYGNVILASHRGNSSISYFKNLNKLINGDRVYLYYNGIKYTYEIVNMYEVPKTGTISIYRDSEENVITLITCKKNEEKQLVFIGNLVNKESY